MSFNDDVRLDTSQVGSGGGGGGAPGGMVVGGGIGGIIMLIIALIFGINPSDLPGGGGGAPAPQEDTSQVEPGGSENAAAFSECKTGADANNNVTCRIIGTVNSVQAYWTAELPRYGKQWQPTKTVLYSGATQSQCGTASNQVGPFYCPLDQRVYIDADFFGLLTQRFGADDGALAQEYVVAHEYGHHVQNLLGDLRKAQQGPQGAQGNGVRSELQADCYAGVWAHYAATTKQAGTDVPFLQPLSDKDIADALSAASSVGDDRIQAETTGRINPERWTHGSSEQRQKWFTVGYQTGDPKQCDTFNARNLS
jgi:predicted metalloprotease